MRVAENPCAVGRRFFRLPGKRRLAHRCHRGPTRTPHSMCVGGPHASCRKSLRRRSAVLPLNNVNFNGSGRANARFEDTPGDKSPFHSLTCAKGVNSEWIDYRRNSRYRTELVQSKCGPQPIARRIFSQRKYVAAKLTFVQSQARGQARDRESFSFQPGVPWHGCCHR